MYNIYISRRCQNCHELLILVHQNNNLNLDISFIDIDSNQYPSGLGVIPSMIVNQNEVISGEELFKFIGILIDKAKNRVTPQLENSSIPIQSDTEQVQSSDKSEDDILDGYCIDGNCALPFSSLDDSVYIDSKLSFESIDDDSISSGNIQTNEDNVPSKSEKFTRVSNDYEKMMKERSENI
jgi:hypothetical protein